MSALAIIVLTLNLHAFATRDFRIGVASADSQQHCLALAGAVLPPGSMLTLMTPIRPQRVFHVVVTESVAECEVMARHDTPGPYYLLGPAGDSERPPALAIAVLGYVTVRVVADSIRVRLDDRYPQARIRICSSSEGLHLTVWSGEPLKTVRLWHAYWYLGFDVASECLPADYGEGGLPAPQPKESKERTGAFGKARSKARRSDPEACLPLRLSVMLYMVVESFRGGDPRPVYRRFTITAGRCRAGCATSPACHSVRRSRTACHGRA
jgi:hypothetical protein